MAIYSYGQLDNYTLKTISEKCKRVIVDISQAYFQIPIHNLDTIYTCRKFFGVADGAFLYTNTILNEKLARDESYNRMHSLLGRFKKSASESYGEHTKNGSAFENKAIKKMSELTENLLHAINYRFVEEHRNQNFMLLHKVFSALNKLELKVPKGAFIYLFDVRQK